MKNGNLYKLSALLMIMVLLSAIGFAQTDENKKVIKKKKTMMISMTVDEDGETTQVDTIVFQTPDVDLDELMKDVELELDLTKDRMKEIHMNILADFDETMDSISFKLDYHADELEKALGDLQKELDQLEMSEETQQRIQETMEKLEKMGEKSFHHFEEFVMDDHPIFINEEGKVKVITHQDGDEQTTKVIWIDKDGNESEREAKELKVWVDSDNENKVIVKVDGDISEENEFVFHTDEGKGEKVIVMEVMGEGMTMLGSAKEKDLDKAIEAGLPIKKDQMIEELNINMEIKDDANPVVSLKTNETAKMTATVYNQDFNKVKKLKLTEKDGAFSFELDKKMLQDEKATYLLIEQAGKTDLMKLKF